MSVQRIDERVARSVGRSTAEVFLRSDFEQIGSYAQVGKALNSLTRRGRLFRLGYGIYAKARTNPLTNQPMPRKPLESLALEALNKLGIPVKLGRAAREYLAGSTQVPTRISYDTGSRRVSRKLRVGREEVMFENDFRRAS